jgi:hypothetical protein
MYDPTVGRWRTEDPIGFTSGDYNLYRYVGNNPTNAVDPTGLKLVVGDHEIKDAGDPLFQEIINTINKGEDFKKELDVAIEILEKMIESRVEKKTYNYKSAEDLVKEIKLRIYIITAAKEWAQGMKDRRVAFPGDNTPIRFTGSSAIEPTRVKMKIDGVDRELTGIRPKDGAPSQALDALRKVSKDNPVIADCASTVYLVILTALRLYLGPDGFDKLFSKEKPFVIAGPYGIDRFVKLTTEKTDLLPGDTRVFENKGAKDPSYVNENTIYLGDNSYYAPGIGIMTYDDLMKWLKDHSNTRIVTPDPSTGKIMVP